MMAALSGDLGGLESCAKSKPWIVAIAQNNPGLGNPAHRGSTQKPWTYCCSHHHCDYSCKTLHMEFYEQPVRNLGDNRKGKASWSRDWVPFEYLDRTGLSFLLWCNGLNKLR